MNSIITGIVLLVLYFLPTGMATSRDRDLVFVINLFFGWTGLGWVAALAIAVRPRGSAQ